VSLLSNALVVNEIVQLLVEMSVRLFVSVVAM
jgi:hypothetical protein